MVCRRLVDELITLAVLGMDIGMMCIGVYEHDYTMAIFWLMAAVLVWRFRR